MVGEKATHIRGIFVRKARQESQQRLIKDSRGAFGGTQKERGKKKAG